MGVWKIFDIDEGDKQGLSVVGNTDESCEIVEAED